MPSRTSPASLNVLFIGNSFTARNDLPALVAQLAAADQNRLQHRLLSIGGASLRTHWNKGEAARAIQTGGYDFVVLQEQSTLPIKNPQRMRENVLLFDEAIRSAGSRTALYLTWARLHAPQSQQAITDAYTSIARDINAALIPAGIAWQKHLTEEKPLRLHDRDASHPTLAGSYLAACCAYATLFRTSPLNNRAAVPGLTAEQMQRLQRVADAVVV